MLSLSSQFRESTIFMSSLDDAAKAVIYGAVIQSILVLLHVHSYVRLTSLHSQRWWKKYFSNRYIGALPELSGKFNRNVDVSRVARRQILIFSCSIHGHSVCVVMSPELKYHGSAPRALCRRRILNPPGSSEGGRRPRWICQHVMSSHVTPTLMNQCDTLIPTNR
jgi:hypothetical protein